MGRRIFSSSSFNGLLAHHSRPEHSPLLLIFQEDQWERMNYNSIVQPNAWNYERNSGTNTENSEV
jgi:hypothetical protein